MANLISTTSWDQVKQLGITTYTVSLSQAATAGSTLIVCHFGGNNLTTLKLTNNAGTAFNKRTAGTGAIQSEIWDVTAAGGETQLYLVVNAADNMSLFVYELGSLGAFVSASNNGAGAAMTTAVDYQSAPSSAVSLLSGNGVLIGGWSVSETFASMPFSSLHSFHQMGPIGNLYKSSANQPGANSQYIYASGLADVSASQQGYPYFNSAGSFQATTMWPPGVGTGFAAQALYADASGLLTNPAPANPIVAENSLPGKHENNWAGLAAGISSSIAGYSDKLSYSPGDTVNFFVDSTGHSFRVEIYRLGYYGGGSSEVFAAKDALGAVGNVFGVGKPGYITGTVVTQPTPVVDATLGSTSCSAAGWTSNASWTIPTTAVPGVYYVLFRRTDASLFIASNHFVVRGPVPAINSQIAIILPDFTYQAYGIWGATTDTSGGPYTGRNVYGLGGDGNMAHRAYGVSFDRPYTTQTSQVDTYMFDAEQGVIEFLEAQGFNVTYYSNADMEDNVDLLNNAKLVIVPGHHEYWTTNMHDCAENSMNAGVNWMFIGGNTATWHVRFNSSDTNKRTLISYKDSSTLDVSSGWNGVATYDPVSYTGSWRDTRQVPGQVNNTDIRPEIGLTGQAFTANAFPNLAVQVPFASKSVPIWRNCPGVQSLTSGTSYSTTTNNFGAEGDMADGSAGQPSNLVILNSFNGGLYNGCANAAATKYTTHETLSTLGFTLYRRQQSGALIFNTGAWRAFWGSTRWYNNKYNSSASTDVNLQNALLALLYDLGAGSAGSLTVMVAGDTALTDGSVGAPGKSTTDRSSVATAYGLKSPRDGNFMRFFG